MGNHQHSSDQMDSLAVALGLENLRALMTPDQVAQILRVSRRRVYELRYSGALPGVQVGRSVRFLPADVITFLEAGRDVDRGRW